MDAFPSPAACVAPTGLGEERRGQRWDPARGAWEACFPSQIGPRTPPKPWGCWTWTGQSSPASGALACLLSLPSKVTSPSLLASLVPHNKVWQTPGA